MNKRIKGRERKIFRRKGDWSVWGLLLVLGILVSCNDEINLKNGTENSDFDGTIFIKVNVPDAEIVKTRSEMDNENLLSPDLKHYVLIYQKDGDDFKLIQRKDDIDLSNSETLTMTVNRTVNLFDIKIIVLSNVSNTLFESSLFPEVGSNYEDLFKITTETLDKDVQPSSPFIMSALAITTETAGVYTVDLQKTVAKISFEMNKEVSDFTLSEYKMYNAPSVGFLTSYVALYEEKNEFIYSSGNNSYIGNSNNGFTNYAYPVKSLGKGTEVNQSGAGTYFIIKGNYQGEECYYRVDLWDDLNKKYLDIDPNHWYKVEIVEVNRKGYATPEEAAQRYMVSDDPSIMIKIYDHVADVLSMTSDGIRELGARESITLTGNGKLKIKLYTPNSSEYDITKINIEVEEGNDWLGIEAPESFMPLETNSQDGKEESDAGKVGEYELIINNSEQIFSRKSALILISWMGLTRRVVVDYNTDFRPEEICEVTLQISSGTGNGNASIDNYWCFIKEDIKGLKIEDLTEGKIRNEGLHFPMPYGEDDSKQLQYSYEFKFKCRNSDNISNISISTTGDPFFNNENLNWEYDLNRNLGNLSLKDPKSNDFTYALGSITFKIEFEEGNGEDLYLTLDLYHTGFFHMADSGTTDAFYYEVVPMGKDEDGNPLYWLDRNIGASSNKMFVGNELVNYGNINAQGKFYKIANVGDYSDATITAETFDNTRITPICPPGYRIPTTKDWDAVRLSPNFVISEENDGKSSFISTYYKTGIKEIGKIYFPRSRFYCSEEDLKQIGGGGTGNATFIYEHSPNCGESDSGYYWTKTPCFGLESAQLGRWLQALRINGKSSTYINGSIDHYEMNVRCISKTSQGPYSE